MAPMLNKEMSQIDWSNKTALEIKNLTRGLNPIMGTFSYLEDKKYKFWKLKNISIEEYAQNFDADINEIKNILTEINFNYDVDFKKAAVITDYKKCRKKVPKQIINDIQNLFDNIPD